MLGVWIARAPFARPLSDDCGALLLGHVLPIRGPDERHRRLVGCWS